MNRRWPARTATSCAASNAVVKESDAHIRFSFIAGVSKFSKVSLFSGLNNLKDITLNPRYSAICGYTDEDLDRVFAPELGGLDRDQVRDWWQSLNRSLLNRILRRLFESFFASIPHQWYTNNDIASYEGFYASVFYSYFAGLGLDVTVEDGSSRGRLDMAVRFNANVYLWSRPDRRARAQSRSSRISSIRRSGSAAPHRS